MMHTTEREHGVTQGEPRAWHDAQRRLHENEAEQKADMKAVIFKQEQRGLRCCDVAFPARALRCQAS